MTGLTRFVQIPLMTVIICLCSWISIPMTVPVTMQTFAVFLALKLLGGRDGTLSILIYLLLGAVGVPVFSSFGSGVGHLLGPTGGFLWGFVLCGLVYMLFEKYIKSKHRSLLALITGTVLCYVVGTVWFILYTTLSGGTLAFSEAIVLFVLPCIIPDAIKLILANLLGNKLSNLIKNIKSP